MEKGLEKKSSNLMSNGIFHIRLAQIKALISEYVYPEPLPIYLKRYFKANKKLGSRDRKQIKEWFYAYFKSDVQIKDLEEELLYLLHQDKSAILDPIRSRSDFHSKIEPKARPYPREDNMSRALSLECIGHLKDEKLTWVRTENEPEEYIEKRENQVYGLAKSNQIQEQNYAQIQDLASFQVSKAIAKELSNKKGEETLTFWDACCGAGGKSMAILSQLSEINADYEWFCTDKRMNVLLNAQKRLTKGTGIHFAQLDLSKKHELKVFETAKYDLDTFDAILLDVPCSGSGTWGRNPQHLRYFKTSQLQEYVLLQQVILKNAITKLSKNGSLFYVTCSIYTSENEDQLQWMLESFDLELKTQSYLGETTSDTLFCAHLVKKS